MDNKKIKETQNSIRISLENFKELKDVYEFYNDCNASVIELETNEDSFSKLSRLFNEDGTFKENTIFNGYWAGYLSNSKKEGNCIVSNRRNFNPFIKELTLLVTRGCKSATSEYDITNKVEELRTRFNDISDSDFNLILDNSFILIINKGVKVDGFLCKLVISEDRLYITREVNVKYAVEFYSSRNTPRVNIYKIDIDATQTVGKVVKENLTEICSVKYKELDDALYELCARFKDVFVLDTSTITDFYGYDDNYFVKITPSKISKWWDYDCSYKLIKYSVNVDNTTNWFGSYLICWEDVLVESTYVKNYISEDITVDEFEAICKDAMTTRIAEDIKRTIQLRELDSKERSAIEEQIKSFETSIQEVIDANRDGIIFKVAAKELSGEESLNKYSTDELIEKLSKIDHGLDWGFLYFKPTSSDDNELFKKAQTLKLRPLGLEISSPFKGFSTYTQSLVASEVVKVVKDKMGISLSFWTVLD